MLSVPYTHDIPAAIAKRVTRRAHADHTYAAADVLGWARAEFDWARWYSDETDYPPLSLAARIDHARKDAARKRADMADVLPAAAIEVTGYREFPNPYADGSVAEVEVCYSRRGYRAIYGVYADGSVSLWCN